MCMLIYGDLQKFQLMVVMRYFLSLIDDFSRKVWVFLLKTKDETLDRFKEWKTITENQIDKKVKVLRTDNGLEFCNVLFDDYCKQCGIERHKTVVGTPQQNGVAERMNRTLLEKVRCLMFTSAVPKSFWGEALNTAAYLVNRSPSTVLNLKCPEEIWNKRSPSLDHLKIFGCSAYAHKNDGKLNPRSVKCVFLGYQEGTKGYRLWERESAGIKILISRDVIFNENTFPCKSGSVKSDVYMPDSSDFSVDFQLYDTTHIEVEHATLPDHSSSAATSHGEEGNTATSQGEEGKITASQEEDGSPQFIQTDDEDSAAPENTTEPVPFNHPNLDDYQLVRDRNRRAPKPNPRYNNYAELVFTALLAASDINCIEPDSYAAAIASKNSQCWKKAMNEEYDSLIKNNTWTLVPRPVKARVIDCKWIFKIKEGISKSDSIKYKARLVAKGYSQKEGIDYNEIFSPVVKFKTIRMMLAIVAFYDLELEQMDVKTAFLNGDLDEIIHMNQPEGFEDKVNKNYVCKLNKSLYGLKQAPRQWYKRFDTFVTQIGFCRSEFDVCLYFAHLDAVPIYLLIYVDDMLLISKSMKLINDLKRKLSAEFDMKDLGCAKKILGIEIERNRNANELKLHQTSYIKKVCTRFEVIGCKTCHCSIGSTFYS
ncbi:hypothetical protein Dimus_039170 [Dionaea muscipula]